VLPVRIVACALFVVFLAACDETVVGPIDRTIDVSTLAVDLNPTGVAPLSARIAFTASRPVSVEVTVLGRSGPVTDVTQRLDELSQAWEVPVLGLYPDTVNTVVLTLFGVLGDEMHRDTVSIETAPLPSDLPVIEIETLVPSEVVPGMNLVSYFGHNGSPTPQRPFMFDQTGAIRWMLDFTGHPTLSELFYDNGVELLANGNLYFGDSSTDAIYEVDRFGAILNRWDLPGYDFHHDVIEKPDGNFIASVSLKGASTIEDWIVEVDRGTGQIVTTWDLRQSLQQERRAWVTNFADPDVDWVHVNGLTYDASDDTIILSGRTQGVVKLTRSNEVVWILAPHREWGTAGDGTDLTTKLLRPLDATGQPITDADVLDGRTAHPDFEWQWYQHAPLLTENGTLMVFDNGDVRQYVGFPIYSRAVEFRIDAGARTVQQVWQYGKERGEETYSSIVSDVDIHERERNVMFMPGAIRGIGKLVEVDYDTRQVVFEATITPPIAYFNLVAFHRIERVSLVPRGNRAIPA